eukprot:g2077.t1
MMKSSFLGTVLCVFLVAVAKAGAVEEDVVLTAEDAVVGVEKVVPLPSKAKAKSRSSLKPTVLADKAFSAYDKDDDEMLDREEFRRYFLSSKARAGVDADEMMMVDGEVKNLGFWTAFVKSTATILATEVGDSTFFIAALMSMTHSRTAVFLGAAGALAVMTVLSTAIGFALPQILPRKYTHFAAALLFSYFGWRLLSEALQMYKEGTGKSTDTNEEFEEAEQELAAKGFVDAHKADAADIEAVPGSSS